MNELITNIIADFTQGTHLYLVELSITGKKVEVFLDGDCGLNVNECGTLNRYIHKRLEEAGIETDELTIDVSSPGIDRALNSIRDYKKNVGRKLQIRNKQQKFLKGTLALVDDEKVILSGVGSKNKMETMNYSQIVEAKIMI